jgi:hypothetical protein
MDSAPISMLSFRKAGSQRRPAKPSVGNELVWKEPEDAQVEEPEQKVEVIN